MENILPLQQLLLIMAGVAVLVITSILSYRLGKGDGYLDHMEEMIENIEKEKGQPQR